MFAYAVLFYEAFLDLVYLLGYSLLCVTVLGVASTLGDSFTLLFSSILSRLSSSLSCPTLLICFSSCWLMVQMSIFLSFQSCVSITVYKFLNFQRYSFSFSMYFSQSCFSLARQCSSISFLMDYWMLAASYWLYCLSFCSLAQVEMRLRESLYRYGSSLGENSLLQTNSEGNFDSLQPSKCQSCCLDLDFGQRSSASFRLSSWFLRISPRRVSFGLLYCISDNTFEMINFLSATQFILLLDLSFLYWLN